jgi:hypothetical protein
MRPPNILDLVHVVTELAPAHPEVAVWWYARAGEAGAPPMLLVLEPRDGARPDASLIEAELARRLGPAAATVRPHRGAGETRALYRLLTADGAAMASSLPGGSR